MSQLCPTCEDYHETRTECRTETYTVRGERISVPVTVCVCEACGEEIGSDEHDQQVLDAVYAEYRRRHG